MNVVCVVQVGRREKGILCKINFFITADHIDDFGVVY